MEEVEVEEADGLEQAEHGQALAWFGPHQPVDVHKRAEDVEGRSAGVSQRKEKDEPDCKEALRELAEAQRGEYDDARADEGEQATAEHDVPA